MLKEKTHLYLQPPPSFSLLEISALTHQRPRRFLSLHTAELLRNGQGHMLEES